MDQSELIKHLKQDNLRCRRELYRLAMISMLPGEKTSVIYKLATYDTVKFIYDNRDYFRKFGDCDMDLIAWDVQLLLLDHTAIELKTAMKEPTQQQIQRYERLRTPANA